MGNAEKAQEYIERLKEASKHALDVKEYTRGVELANAARALQEWQGQGRPGEMPVDLAALLGEEAVEVPAPPSEVESALGAEAKPLPEGEADKRLRDLLEGRG
jgi:hypothetical protein